MAPRTRESYQPSVLRSPSELVADVRVPSDLLVAVMTRRPELLQAMVRPFDLEEAGAILHLIGVLLETNDELQRHSHYLAQQIEQITAAFGGIETKLARLEDAANFRTETDPDDEE